MNSPELIVVGGGVIGLSCAWRLAQHGRKVLLLERATCGAGATLASLGALWPPSPLIDKPAQNLHRKSLGMFEAFAAEAAAAAGMPVTFRRLGHFDVLAGEKQVANARLQAAAATAVWPGTGLPLMEVLSPDQLRQLEPQVTAACAGALLCRVSAQVRVDQLVAALRAACVQAGVKIIEHTAVESLLTAGGAVRGVVTAGRTHCCQRVLLAAGAWTDHLCATGAASLGIKPVRGQALLLRHMPPLVSRIVKHGPVYFVPWDDGHVLLGSTTEPEAGWNCFPTAGGVAHLLELAAATIPAVAQAEVVRVWAGLRPDAPQHQPIIGPVPGVAGLFVAAGHYKTGIGMAPITAQMVTEQMAR